MKLESAYGDVWTSASSQKNFEFSNSPILFKILSDSLYSNKIGSIVRELGANARDAHKVAGTPNLPFEITIEKSSLFYMGSSIFSVKDKGIGLSEKEIYEVYTVYGESLKRHTNELVGGFGIGSKSPFAYSETFTVISTHKGKRTVYTAYIDSQGYPAISKMMEDDSTEHDGLEVIIPIKEQDLGNFRFEVSNQLFGLNPRPVCKGFDVNWGSNEILHKTPEWEIRKFKSMYNTHWAVDIDGFIYLFDACAIIKDNRMPLTFSEFTHGYVVFPLSIGEIDLSASRETVAYTKKTIDVLKEKIEKFLVSLYKEALEYKKSHSKYDTAYFCRKVIPYQSLYDTHVRLYQDSLFDKVTYNDLITITDSNLLSYRVGNKVYHLYSLSERYSEYIRSCVIGMGVCSTYFQNKAILEFKIGVGKVVYCPALKNKRKYAQHLHKLGYSEVVLITGVEQGSAEYNTILDFLGNPTEIDVVECPAVQRKRPEPTKNSDGETEYSYTCSTGYTTQWIYSLKDYDVRGDKRKGTVADIFTSEKMGITFHFPMNGNKVQAFSDCKDEEMVELLKCLSFASVTPSKYAMDSKIHIRFVPKNAWTRASKLNFEMPTFKSSMEKLSEYVRKYILEGLDKNAVNVINEVIVTCPELINIIMRSSFRGNNFRTIKRLNEIFTVFEMVGRDRVKFFMAYNAIQNLEYTPTFDWKGYYNSNPILKFLKDYDMSDKEILETIKYYLK